MASPGGIGPSLGGFQSFVTNIMAVPDTATYANPDVIQWAYDFAYDWVNKGLQLVQAPSGGYTMFARAVYNLAADTLINWAEDAPDASAYKTNKDGTAIPYWQWLRGQYGVLDFVAGVVQSTSDEGTSASYLVPDAFKDYTIANLGNLKTPFGRAYLGIAQSWGTQWGIS